MKKFTISMCGILLLLTITFQADEIIIINEENYNQVGNDLVITNVTYKIEAVPDDFRGVYSSCNNMRFENVTIDADETIKSNASSVGSLCGDASNSTFTNVTNNSSLSSTSTTGDAYGGLVGNIVDGTFKDVNNNGVVSASSANIGGIVGSGENINIDGATNNGNIIGHQTQATEVGGIGGKLINSHLYQAENMGDIQGKSNIGGLVGEFTWTSTFDCNKLLMSSTKNEYNVCGIIESLNAGDITGNTYNVGGVVGTVNNEQNYNQIVNTDQANNQMYILLTGSINSDITISGEKSIGDNVGGLVGLVESTTKNVPEHANSQMTSAMGINFIMTWFDTTDGTINKISGHNNVGGVAGLTTTIWTYEGGQSSTNQSVFINKTIVANSKIIGSSNIGGIVGNNDALLLEASVNNTTKVRATESGAGGFSGLNNGVIKDSRMSGTVLGDKNIGGVVGINKGSVDSVLSSGYILPKSGKELDYPSTVEYVGGLIGRQPSGRTTRSIYYPPSQTIENDTVNFIPSFHGYLGQSNDAAQLAIDKYQFVLDQYEPNIPLEAMSLLYIYDLVDYKKQKLITDGDEELHYELEELVAKKEEELTKIAAADKEFKSDKNDRKNIVFFRINAYEINGNHRERKTIDAATLYIESKDMNADYVKESDWAPNQYSSYQIIDTYGSMSEDIENKLDDTIWFFADPRSPSYEENTVRATRYDYYYNHLKMKNYVVPVYAK